MANDEVQAFPQIAELKPVRKGQRQDGLEHVQEFLSRFGYVPAPDAPARGVLDDATAEALTRFQRFMNLPESGEFDERTRRLMTTPRCAMPDLSRGVEFATTCSWQQSEITYAFDTGTADVPGNTEFQAVRNAFGTWAAVIPVTFREVGVNDSPNVRIGWRPASDPDLSMVGGTLAHADFPPGCGVVTNTLPKPVHFDDEEHTWSVGAVVGAFDVETVALHEIGHILGLAHSNVTGAVMAPTIGSNLTKRALTQDDISGVQSLYGMPAQPGRRCIIATAAFGSEIAPEIHFLRGIRDNVLRQMQWGRRWFEMFEEQYYRVSPPVADAMHADPELRSAMRWAIVEPWTYYMKLLVARPDWDRVDFDALDPGLREFLTQLRSDMDAWLDAIELPTSFEEMDADQAVRELNTILDFVRRSGGLDYLDDLRSRGQLPISHAPAERDRLEGALRRAGRRDEEVERILN